MINRSQRLKVALVRSTKEKVLTGREPLTWISKSGSIPADSTIKRFAGTPKPWRSDNDSTWRNYFPRNEQESFAEYMSERPGMSAKTDKKEEKTRKGN